MFFENKLISGQFIKRYKRFFVDIKIKNKIITAHCLTLVQCMDY